MRAQIDDETAQPENARRMRIMDTTDELRRDTAELGPVAGRPPPRADPLWARSRRRGGGLRIPLSCDETTHPRAGVEAAAARGLCAPRGAAAAS